MRWLKILLVVNGAVFLLYAATNTIAPTSYFLPSDAPDYAISVVRVVAMTYLAMGLIQVGMWWVMDRLAIRIVAGASLVLTAGFAILAATGGSASSDAFHQLGVLAGATNAIVAILYAFLLYRERQEQA